MFVMLTIAIVVAFTVGSVSTTYYYEKKIAAFTKTHKVALNQTFTLAYNEGWEFGYDYGSHAKPVQH